MIRKTLKKTKLKLVILNVFKFKMNIHILENIVNKIECIVSIKAYYYVIN